MEASSAFLPRPPMPSVSSLMRSPRQQIRWPTRRRRWCMLLKWFTWAWNLPETISSRLSRSTVDSHSGETWSRGRTFEGEEKRHLNFAQLPTQGYSEPRPGASSRLCHASAGIHMSANLSISPSCTCVRYSPPFQTSACL